MIRPADAGEISQALQQIGGFHFLPGKEHHYAFTTGRTIIQINGNGPFDINYIDPADDPQKARM